MKGKNFERKKKEKDQRLYIGWVVSDTMVTQ